MPRAGSTASPRKALGESSGNAGMRPPDRFQASCGTMEKPQPQRAGGPSSDATTSPSKKTNEGASRRTRSSKYLKSLLEREKPAADKQSLGPQSKQGHKRSKSSNNIYSVFPRPTSSKEIKETVRAHLTGKENTAPPDTPIWAQFATTTVPLNDLGNVDNEITQYTPQAYSPSKQRKYPLDQQPTLGRRPQQKPRPKSECLAEGNRQTSFIDTLSTLRHSRRSQDLDRSKQEPEIDAAANTTEPNADTAPESTANKRGSRVMAAVAAFNVKSRQQPAEPSDKPSPVKVDPKVIDSAFESLLVSNFRLSASKSPGPENSRTQGMFPKTPETRCGHWTQTSNRILYKRKSPARDQPLATKIWPGALRDRE